MPTDLTRRMPASILAGAAACLMIAGCVGPRCSRNSECPAGQVCRVDVGRCLTPECTASEDCPGTLVCDDYACVPGCKTSDDCDDGYKCFSGKCVPEGGECDCPAAPGFCALDANPGSATHGKDLCVPEDFPDGAALFFGSVLCSHCRDIFDALQRMAHEISSQGGKVPALVWVQLSTVSAGSNDFAAAVGDAKDPVVLDTSGIDVWGRYDADWYHVVIVDRNGCLAGHFGPLTAEQVDGKEHQAILDAWTGAMEAECVQTGEEVADAIPDAPYDAMDAPPPYDTDEATADVVDALDVPADLEEPDAGSPDLDIAVDGQSEQGLPDLVEEDSQDAGDAEPFVLAQTCQVVTGPPIQVGDPVPHFLCADVNTTSSSFGLGVSEIVLKEMVWIAYFGSCT